MALRFRVDVFGDTQFARELVNVGERAGDLNPAFHSIFARLMEISAEQFHTLGARGGTPWAPLAANTIRQKAAEGVPHPEWPLWRTEALFEAMTSPGDPNNEEILNGDWAVWRVLGEPGEYGRYHQSGTRDMPARPPFRLTEEDRREFVREMQHFIMTGTVRHFL